MQRIGQALAGRIGRRATFRRPLRANLTRALGGAAPDLVERFADRAMASYGRYWVEGAMLPRIPAERVAARFQIVEGMEHLRAAHEAGRGVIVALPHMGSWEWGGAFLATIGLPMTAVAEALEPPELFEWFARQREEIGIHVVALDDHASTRLLETLRAGGIVGLLCDRDLTDGGIEVTFFGERVTLPAGPATLALRTGATIVAAACYSGPGDGHFAVIRPPLPVERRGRLREDVTRVTQAIAHELEGLIQRAPEQWHVLEDRFGDA